ncbi:MAG: LAGLIDADG family homing endonuclease [Candidatus Aenigmarchaeota archaeon]|nr:LAGLIDADG family homing endonuclease [Candidatus Aenigmarchaeota archaeon]
MKLNFINQNFGKTEINEIDERQGKMAQLIGLLITDGSLWCNKKSGLWSISFTSNSNELVAEFERLIFEIFHLKLRKRIYKGSWEVKSGISRKAAAELISYSPSYRTLAYNKAENKYPGTIIPEFILSNSELGKQFLRYAFTGDGTVIFNIGKARYGFRFDRCVKLYSEHPNLRKQYFGLLEKLGYKPTMLKDAVLLRKPENIKKFEREIGFVEGVKISGNGLWKGIPKSQLLKFAANSYGLKPSELGKTKSDIHTNLIKLIL